MRYMGDLPDKPDDTEDPLDDVYEILMSCHEEPGIIDEVYCQILKQITSNKGDREREREKMKGQTVVVTFVLMTKERYSTLGFMWVLFVKFL